MFKTFEVEAFVIPTGSMAPTLKGRHKDVVCDECGYQFQTSASEEIDASTNRRSGFRVVGGVCPQCGFTLYFGDAKPSLKNDKRAPSFTGDRILVSKLAFDQRELSRWDATVFRAPSDPKINYIKRIVGLPNENLRVQYGDLFVQKLEPGVSSKASPEYYGGTNSNELAPDVDLALTNNPQNDVDGSSRPQAEGVFTIARKDYKYLRQILQVVHDDDFYSAKLQAVGWPECWLDDLAQTESSKSAWSRVNLKKGRGFLFDGSPVDSKPEDVAKLSLASRADVTPIAPDDSDLYWLRFRHIVPSSTDWSHIIDGKLPPDVESSGIVRNNPRLIDDFSAYNAGISRKQATITSSSPSGGSVSKLVGEWDRSGMDEFSHLSRTKRLSDGSELVFLEKNPDGFGCNWVGDLAVSCELQFKQFDENTKLAFDLVKGGIVFRCVVSPSEGLITLLIPEVSEFEPVSTAYQFVTNAKYKFVFVNVDEEMRVVVNDEELVFPESGGRYDRLTDASANVRSPIARNRDPNARDLSPVAIGVKDCSVSVEHLKVLRDVYYIAAGRMMEPWDAYKFSDFNTSRCDRLTALAETVYLGDETDAAKFMSSPELWRGYGNTKSLLLTQLDDQYVAFGDNSGFSLDSRLWCDGNAPHYVDKKYLIGKAFYVYWPHGLPLPLVRSPYWPNVSKMRHVD